MKKIIYSMMVFAMATFSLGALTSCEDVPAPYDIPNGGDDGGDETTVAKAMPYTSNSLSDWTAVTPKGTAWSLGSSYAKASGYDNSAKTYTESEAWLVSPVINTTTSSGVVINFDHVIRYVYDDATLANHKMYVSKNYTGDVTTATWTELAYEPVASTTNTWDFYAAKTITLPAEYLNTEVVVAFKFVCGSTTSTTWELQNFSMKEGTGSVDPVNPDPVTPVAGNLLANGDFESWTSGQPDNWKSTSTASNATLSQSTDAHGGSYSVSVGYATQNKRLAYKELTLKAGTYTFSFWAKSTTTDPSQCRIGYVPVTSGSVGSYNYATGYTTLSNTAWTQVSNTFTLDATTTICLVVMNPKSSGSYCVAQNILVDDASLTTTDGGIAEGEDTPSAGDGYKLVTTIADGNYIIAANTSGTSYAVAKPVTAGYSYGWMYTADATLTNGALSASAENEFTIKHSTKGYTIQDASGRYYYMNGTYNSFQVSDTMGSTDAYYWDITFKDNNVVIKNVEKQKTVQYSASYTSYGAYSDLSNTLPSLFKK